MKTEEALLNQTRTYLKDSFAKIEKCVQLLSDEDLWWRAHETNNSVGNLMLHLAGSIRYWIVSGVGGAPDRRNRQQEFDECERLSKAFLLDNLRAALDEADGTLASLDVAEILSARTIGPGQRTPLQALLHATQHFADHLGQIVYITKLRTGTDVGLTVRRAGGKQ